MGTVFTKPIVINAPDKDIVFDGCDFTGDAYVTITTAASVSFLNCRFYKCTPYQAKSYLVTGASVPVKIVVENCFFGENPSMDGKAYYNLFELNTKLKDGSSFSNNYFLKGCCTHNMLNFYDVDASGETEPVIKVAKNVFEYSGNAVRIGLKGSPKCTLNFTGNRYDATDVPEWAGLILIQPYGAQTTTFNDMKVNIDGTVNNSGNPQIIYIFSNPTDAQFNYQTNYPKVYIDGVLVEKLTATSGTTVKGDDPTTEEDESAMTDAAASEETV